jgi:hypothetical protein
MHTENFGQKVLDKASKIDIMAQAAPETASPARRPLGLGWGDVFLCPLFYSPFLSFFQYLQ